MLLELSEVISDTVAELFIKTLDSGDVPLDWKLANVTAIFKRVKIKSFRLSTSQLDGQFM